MNVGKPERRPDVSEVRQSRLQRKGVSALGTKSVFVASETGLLNASLILDIFFYQVKKGLTVQLNMLLIRTLVDFWWLLESSSMIGLFGIENNNQANCLFRRPY